MHNAFDWRDNAVARTMQQRRVGNMPSVRPERQFWRGVGIAFLISAPLWGLFFGVLWYAWSGSPR